ncbi:hypothetical protein Cadr_000010921 [Camelus dromedarius]|uniref:Uncharacterized protein n=1 Tax=Camelus dromedarius TaxID=9838 RepID=A0A5N4DUF3_CAMDR|nr:hypothetical protein Cadr_000010921 [Camelus dromedarius]
MLHACRRCESPPQGGLWLWDQEQLTTRWRPWDELMWLCILTEQPCQEPLSLAKGSKYRFQVPKALLWKEPEGSVAEEGLDQQGKSRNNAFQMPEKQLVHLQGWEPFLGAGRTKPRSLSTGRPASARAGQDGFQSAPRFRVIICLRVKREWNPCRGLITRAEHMAAHLQTSRRRALSGTQLAPARLSNVYASARTQVGLPAVILSTFILLRASSISTSSALPRHPFLPQVLGTTLSNPAPPGGFDEMGIARSTATCQNRHQAADSIWEAWLLRRWKHQEDPLSHNHLSFSAVARGAGVEALRAQRQRERQEKGSERHEKGETLISATGVRVRVSPSRHRHPCS